MKRLFLTMLALSIGVAMFAQGNSSEKNPDGNEFVGKKIAVFANCYQCDYDANKRTMSKMGAEAEAMAQSNAQMITNMMSWYGGKVLSSYDSNYAGLQMFIQSIGEDKSLENIQAKANEFGIDYSLLKDYVGYSELQSLIQTMNGESDFSCLQAKAKEFEIDYVLLEDLVWMMYKDQLFIYEYQSTVLEVENNIVDRKSSYSYINALKDAANMNAAADRITVEHAELLKEMATRITPRLWGIVGLSKNGKKADMYSVTFAGYYPNDVFQVYNVSGDMRNLDGKPTAFVKLTPVAKSTKFEIEDPKYIVNLDAKIQLDPANIVSAGSLITSNIPGVDYPSVPISIVALGNANADSYDAHNREVTNYALYNAVHKNKMLQVVANVENSEVTPQYECKLSDYSENKNIVQVKLTITDLSKNIVVKETAIESHTSNLDVMIAYHMNDVFGSATALGNVDKKTISYYVQSPIAYKEGEKFMLSLNDGNHTPVAIYTLLTWKGQEYVFEEVKVLNKKAANKIGKDAAAQYVLTRYVDPLKDPKKDNSEFKKVAAANKMMDLIAK